ncbi:MAG TPA: hypothetical protein VGA77_04730 [Propylenella sp.]
MNAGGEDGSRKLRLFLHIGAHKTGSTSIQTRLSENAESLKEHGFLYPLGRFERWSFQHSAIVDLVLRAEPEGLASLLRGIREEAVSAKCHTVILSGENISQLPGGKIAVLRDALLAAGFAPVVVVFFRRYFDHVRSRASERMKGRGSYITPSVLAGQLKRLGRVDIAGRFASVFGAENVIRHDLGSDDDSVALLDQDIGLTAKLPAQWANTRLDFATLSWLNAIKAELDVPSSVVQRLYMQSFEGRPPVLAAEAAFLAEVADMLGRKNGDLLRAELQRLKDANDLQSLEERLAHLKMLNRFISRLRRYMRWKALQRRFPRLFDRAAGTQGRTRKTTAAGG